FIGWAVAVAVVWSGVPDSDARGQRALWAVVLAVGSIVLGIVILWVWSHVEGGVMDPFAYLDARFGPIAYLNVIVAGVVAYQRARRAGRRVRPALTPSAGRRMSRRPSPCESRAA
ncbi:MAG TPA: hypothetical protein VIZ22_13100, partial [Candidatus Limnocylindrales bacterium]